MPGKCSRHHDDALRPASSKSSAHRMPGEFLKKSVVWASGFFVDPVRATAATRSRGLLPDQHGVKNGFHQHHRKARLADDVTAIPGTFDLPILGRSSFGSSRPGE